MLFVIGFTLVAALLVTVVVNASKVFLTQRALSAAADGAALAAVDALDEVAFYGGARGETLRLDDAAAGAAVADYVASAGLTERFDGFEFTTGLGGDGTTVTVTCGSRVALPFINAVSDAYNEGYPLSVTASARAPITP